MPVQTQTGGRGRLIAPIHSKPATRKMWAVSTTRRQIYALERPGSHCKTGCVSLAAGLKGTGSLSPLRTVQPHHIKM
jgi:hypothetical protein